jgi:hypothetical protein
MNQWTETLRHGRRVTIRPIRVDDGFAVRPNSDDVRQFICSLDLQSPAGAPTASATLSRAR